MFSGKRMLPILAVCLALLVNAVVSIPYDTVISSRQISQNCSTTCSAMENCNDQYCKCTDDYLQAMGNCYVCTAESPQDVATWQIVLDEMINWCHKEGIPVQVTVQLQPDAQAIVDKYYHERAILRTEQGVFLALQVTGGHVGLVIVLAFAIFSRKVRRDPTFFNFCITWILSSIFYSLSLYTGMYGNPLTDPFILAGSHLCLAQSWLISGAQVMTSSSTMALVVQLWISLRTTIDGGPPGRVKHKNWVTYMLLALPYVLFVTVIITSALIFKALLAAPYPANFYCYPIDSDPHAYMLRTVYGVTLVFLLITAVFDALIIIILYRQWRVVRRFQSGDVTVSILFRVIFFSMYRGIVTVTYAALLGRPPRVEEVAGGLAYSVPVWIDMLQATIPLVAFFVLGMNKDMLTSIMFCRRKVFSIPPSAPNSSASEIMSPMSMDKGSISRYGNESRGVSGLTVTTDSDYSSV